MFASSSGLFRPGVEIEISRLLEISVCESVTLISRVWRAPRVLHALQHHQVGQDGEEEGEKLNKHQLAASRPGYSTQQSLLHIS